MRVSISKFVGVATFGSACVSPKQPQLAQGKALDDLLTKDATASFKTSCARAQNASKQSLELNGYRVVVNDRARGLVATAPRFIEAFSDGVAYHSPLHVSTYRADHFEISASIEVTLKADHGVCTLSLRPNAFVNNAEDPEYQWRPAYVREKLADPFFRKMERVLGQAALQSVPNVLAAP